MGAAHTKPPRYIDSAYEEDLALAIFIISVMCVACACSANLWRRVPYGLPLGVLLILGSMVAVLLMSFDIFEVGAFADKAQPEN